MGVPKKLTDQQMKFANLLVTEEGRKTATQCAVEAGYSKEWARRNILGQDDQEIEMIDKQIADEQSEGENEDEFNDLSAGTLPPEEKGALESELDEQDGNLEKEIGK